MTTTEKQTPRRTSLTTQGGQQIEFFHAFQQESGLFSTNRKIVELQVWQLSDMNYYFRVEGGFPNYITKRQFRVSEVHQIQTFNIKCFETGTRTTNSKHSTVYSCNFIFSVSLPLF